MHSSQDGSMANAFVPGKVVLDAHLQDLIERRSKVLGTAYRLMYEEPLHVSGADGVWLIGADGRKYLDAYNNVTSLGHCHPNVASAIADQVRKMATNTRYLQDITVECAERLLSLLPSEISNVMFTCSGSESNDLAYRIAKFHTDGTGVIVTETAYHGITDTVSQFSPSLGSHVRLGPHVVLVPPPDSYRFGKHVGEKFVDDVGQALVEMKKRGVKPAALIIDSLFTSDGIMSDPPDYLASAAELVRSAGGLYIADEVQSGFGRTGTHMWGFERHGVVPDIVTMGKPMGNGHPVAAIAARPEIISEFGTKARYFNTFGGNSVSCAAALAVIDVIQKQGLMENVVSMGAALREGLWKLAGQYAQLGDVRGAGLMIGLEIVRKDGSNTPDKEEATRLVNALRKFGVLVSSCGARHNVLKIRPPLVFTSEHAGIFLSTLEKALTSK